MFCGFNSPPKIVRLHGHGEVFPFAEAAPSLRRLFPDLPGARALIHVRLTRISDSCGFGVPLMEHAGDRDILVRGAEAKGPEGLAHYRREKNARSVDRLPALAPLEPRVITS
jgi:hypothetical protein